MNNDWNSNWITKLEKLENITSVIQKEWAEELLITHILVNNNNEIKLVINDTINILNKKILTKDDIIEYINKIEKNNDNYKFNNNNNLGEVLYFFYDMNPDQMLNYSQNDNISKIKFKLIYKGLQEIKDIELVQSIFILHDIHCLYIMYYELPKIVSIIKKNNNNTLKKKVSFKNNNNNTTDNKYNTTKHYSE